MCRVETLGLATNPWVILFASLTMFHVSGIHADTLTLKDGRKLDNVLIALRQEKYVARFCDGHLEEFAKSRLSRWNRVPVQCPGAASSSELIDKRFRNNGDGTILDAQTKILWQRCSVGQSNDLACGGSPIKFMDWKVASSACESLSLASKHWRLPTKEELKSIVYCSDGTVPSVDWDSYADIHPSPHSCGWSGGDRYHENYQRPTINNRAFPGTQVRAYWTGTSFTNIYFNEHAWWVAFLDGQVKNSSEVEAYARCVASE